MWLTVTIYDIISGMPYWCYWPWPFIIHQWPISLMWLALLPVTFIFFNFFYLYVTHLINVTDLQSVTDLWCRCSSATVTSLPFSVTLLLSGFYSWVYVCCAETLSWWCAWVYVYPGNVPVNIPWLAVGNCHFYTCCAERLSWWCAWVRVCVLATCQHSVAICLSLTASFMSAVLKHGVDDLHDVSVQTSFCITLLCEAVHEGFSVISTTVWCFVLFLCVGVVNSSKSTCYR